MSHDLFDEFDDDFNALMSKYISKVCPHTFAKQAIIRSLLMILETSNPSDETGEFFDDCIYKAVSFYTLVNEQREKDKKGT